MSKQRDGFVLYKTHYAPIKDFTDEQLGRLFRCIFEWQINGKTNPDKDISIAFAFIENQFRIDDSKYNDRCETNRASIMKRWHTNEYEGIQTYTIDTDKEEDKDKEKDVGRGISMATPTTRTKFRKPTPEEVRSYCMEKNYPIDADAFWDYYECNGWVVGKSPMRDWRAAVRTWARKEKKSSAVNCSDQQGDRILGPEEILKMMSDNG